MDLPYRCEYSRSSRAKCKGCKLPIAQGILRLAVMVQSPFFDGKQPNWHHFECFFKKQRPQTVDDIENFESLHIEDQDRIKTYLNTITVVVPDGKGVKRSAKDKKIALEIYSIQYAKSGRSVCRGCEQKILKDEVRISKKDFESDNAKQIGGVDQWYHTACFATLRSELGYFETGEKLPGYKDLKKEDQAEIKKTLKEIKQEDVPEEKKPKIEESDPDEKLYRNQNKIMMQYRDNIKILQKDELNKLLSWNYQEIPNNSEEKLDRVADMMSFGALKRCAKCKDGQLIFKKAGYSCSGGYAGWSNCTFVTKKPKRSKVKIPEDLTKKYKFLKDYKPTVEKRVFKNVTQSVKKEEKPNESPKVKRERPALYEMEFVILGTPARGKEVLKKQIQALGGKVITKISNSVMAVIASKDMVEKSTSRIQEAESNQVHVISEDFIDEAKNFVGKIPELILKKNICDWGSNPANRLSPEPSTSNNESNFKSRSRFVKSQPDKIKIKLKGGKCVDPDSGLENVAHIFKDYTTVLGKTDVQRNKNSYYKMQLLRSDSMDKTWLFRSWGRIGTTVGGTKCEEVDNIHDGIHKFEEYYEDRTFNAWEERDYFIKISGKMYPLDLDYGVDHISLTISDTKSDLKQPIQDLIKLIFDVKLMEKTMIEFELNTEKMPLGKLSRKQIQLAYGELATLQNLVDEQNQQQQIVEATNRFYTYIPHNFGVDEVPILNDKEMIKQKSDMLDSLLEMEAAYTLMKASEDPSVDSFYKQLKTEIDVLDKKSEEFAIIQEYVKNTHAPTHTSFQVEIEEVYTIKREGEEKRFEPFKKLPNRKLLWHGSRITNFVGILSQGLKIAPPEAPVSGDMFGKGLYFADRVSKSAHFCCTTPTETTGLLLLCEVALGNIVEIVNCEDYTTKLPQGKDSVKGVGRIHPDSSLVKYIDGAEVPLGKSIAIPGTESHSLLHNEYIVYDTAQARIKYLIKANFQYKY